jgi:hypothetical protein
MAHAATLCHVCAGDVDAAVRQWTLAAAKQGAPPSVQALEVCWLLLRRPCCGLCMRLAGRLQRRKEYACPCQRWRVCCLSVSALACVLPFCVSAGLCTAAPASLLPCRCGLPPGASKRVCGRAVNSSLHCPAVFTILTASLPPQLLQPPPPPAGLDGKGGGAGHRRQPPELLGRAVGWGSRGEWGAGE